MITSVPESLFVFLRLIFGGQDLLEEDPDEDDPYCDDPSQKEAKTGFSVLHKTLCTILPVANTGHQKILGLDVHCTRQQDLKNL